MAPPYFNNFCISHQLVQYTRISQARPYCKVQISHVTAIATFTSGSLLTGTCTTPQFTNLAIPLSVPGASQTSSKSDSAPTSTTVIVDIIFTEKYALQPVTSRSSGESTKLGIGIGVGVGVVVILVVGFFLWRWKLWKERHRSEHGGSQHHAPAGNENFELDAAGIKPHLAQPELDGKARSELPTEPEPARPSELPVQ
ncbi:hypothetical protein NA56DRAFT_664539 [Hyaloscypha hepaticicola]|uniref:Mid2 domain-containing protein n=1 Tax=Hyaloscypha hepaticicola TaxID=2082293 RepID=A0A2J6PKT1_9HELO|nr:hypothetical protein NA56DRAFT_664539 [Hyaloscypha hepaticicola]